jgi:hypothetical protein
MPKAQVVVSVLGNVKNLQSALGEAEKASRSFGDKVSAAGKKMTTFVSVPIVGFLGASMKAAIDDAAAQDKLATVVKNLKGDSDALVKTVEDQILKFQKVSTFTDDQLRPAYQNLLVATKDVDQSQKLMTIAMDIAAAKGLDLETVTKAMQKAHDGNAGALGKLGIATKDASGETFSFDQIMANATETFGGSAQNAAETTAGKMQNLKRDVGELSEKIGAEMLPAFEKVTGFFLDDLIPTLDKVSGDNGALVLLGFALAGPVLTAVGNLKNAVFALNGAFTTLAANPGVAALLVISTQIPKIKKDVEHLAGTKEEKGIWAGIQEFIFGDVSKTGGQSWTWLKDKIPGLAGGGAFSGAAVVGEHGPELLVGSGTVLPMTGGGGPTVINLTVNGWVGDDVALTRKIIAALNEEARRSGSLVA